MAVIYIYGEFQGFIIAQTIAPAAAASIQTPKSYAHASVKGIGI